MAACPFCHASLDEQIVIYGGTCPSCFGHVPGEEAATDPGEAVTAALDLADDARARRRTLLPVLMALPVVLGTVAVATYMVLAPTPQLELLNLDDEAYYTPGLDVLVAYEDEGTASEDTTPAAKPTQQRRSASTSQGTAPQTRSGVKRPNIAVSGSADEALDGLEAEDGSDEGLRGRKVQSVDKGPSGGMQASTAVGTSTAQTSSVDVSVGAGSAQTALSNPRAIQKMVIRYVNMNLPRLQVCYESELKAKPKLKGRWTLNFVVKKNGSAGNIQITGQGVNDANLERCISTKIGKWRFQRIATEQPVRKSVTFRKG